MHRARSILYVALISMASVAAPAAPQDASDAMTAAARRAIVYSVEHNEFSVFTAQEMDWSRAQFYWVDLDGDRHPEAIVTVWTRNGCGYFKCPNYIVKWTKGRAAVVDVIDDDRLEVLPTRTKGWSDIHAYYYDYRWDGKLYRLVCRPGGVCEDG